MKTREEMNKLLKDAANPDKAAEALTDISESLTELFDTLEAGNANITKLNETVSELRDSNMRLFLRVTSEPEKGEEENQEEKFLESIEKQIFDNLGGN